MHGVSSEGDLYVGLYEQVGDEVSFFPKYANVAHFGAGFCVRVFVNCFLLVLGVGCGVGGWIGKVLLCRIFWMVVTSAL